MSNKYEYMNNPALWCSDIADAIREKTGETGLIDAVDFPEKIQEISGTIDYVNEYIRSIGDYAYKGMSNLTSVYMPNVREIDRDAFSQCENLESVTMSDNLTTIGYAAFHYCKKLKDIFIGNNVTNIDGMAFYYCENLTNIQLGTSLTNIGDNAFDGCSSLTDIIIPDSVTTIGEFVFNGCDNLTDITVSPDNPNYCSVDGNLFDKNQVTLIRYPIGKQHTNYTIPNGVTTIDKGAFGGCLNLTDIVIPDGITSINSSAFWGCKNLTNITLPDSVTSIDGWAFGYCENFTDITIPSGVININKNTFYSCENLINVTLPDTIITIDESAFNGCDSLKNIKIPDTVTTIGGYAFCGCEILDNIVIPEGITTISDGTFYYCRNLTNIVIPHSVTNIGYQAFGECPNLTDIYYYGTEEDWNSISIGSDNECLTNATIHYIDDPSKQVCTIKYDGNGGNISIANVMGVEGNTITLNYTQPTKFLHRFLGWSTDPDATEAQYQPGDSYTVTEDVTLYAVWEQTAQVKTLTYQAPETVDSAIISVGGEHYYFKFTPTESGYYTFSSTIPNGEGDGYCYLYDGQGIQLASDDDSAGNLNFNLGYYMEANTTYYYGVKYWDGSFTGTIPVRLFMEVK